MAKSSKKHYAAARNRQRYKLQNRREANKARKIVKIFKSLVRKGIRKHGCPGYERLVGYARAAYGGNKLVTSRDADRLIQKLPDSLRIKAY